MKFVNLHWRPDSLLEAAGIAKLVARIPTESNTGRIQAGNQLLDSYIRAPLREGGCAALCESTLAGVMMSLQRGSLVLLRHSDRHVVPVTCLGELGEWGLLDRAERAAEAWKTATRLHFNRDS